MDKVKLAFCLLSLKIKTKGEWVMNDSKYTGFNDDPIYANQGDKANWIAIDLVVIATFLAAFAGLEIGYAYTASQGPALYYLGFVFLGLAAVMVAVLIFHAVRRFK